LGLSLIETDLNSLISHPKYSKSLNPEVVEQLKFCVQSVRDANDNTNTSIVVLNDMLQYDKIESNSLQCECIETDIWDIIRQACHELSLQAKATHVTLTMKLQVDLPESDESWRVTVDGAFARLKTAVVVGDPIKLGQVVRNLISNALKFSPPGGEVTVHGECRCLSSLETIPHIPLPPSIVCSLLRILGLEWFTRDPNAQMRRFLSALRLYSDRGSRRGSWNHSAG
jgi:signal transduction histidine kinase